MNWPERICAFSRSPSQFLSANTAEAFLADLLRELRDDRLSYNDKVGFNIRVGTQTYTFRFTIGTPIRFKTFRDSNQTAQNKSLVINMGFYSHFDPMQLVYFF